MRLKNCFIRWLAAAVCLLLSLSASADGGTLVVQGSGYDQQVYQEESVTMMVKGDLDDNGVVDINDLNAMVNLILGRSTLFSDRADLNFDGKVGVADLNNLVNAMLGRVATHHIYTVNGVSFTMVEVEGGTFMMGDTSNGGGKKRTLSGYSIGQTEVTQELWVAVMGYNPSCFNSFGNTSFGSYHDRDYGINLQRPVEFVNFSDCQKFITKLNQLTGEEFHLPTEVQWEFAARGGNKTHDYKYAGSDVIDEVAWYNETAAYFGQNDPNYGTHTVATKIPNELGLYDMSVNVVEWCQDKYSSNSEFHVIRNGGWASESSRCTVWYRSFFNTIYDGKGDNTRNSWLGFRLAQH